MPRARRFRLLALGAALSYFFDPQFCIGCAPGLPGFDTHDVAVIILDTPVPSSVTSTYGALPAPPSSSELANYWRPYLETCIERFGPSRCMFESNYPVEKMGIGYAALWNAFKRITTGASQGEKLAMFSGTARRAYRLD